MVFSSLPAYHHDPANWQQQPNHPNIITSSAGMSGGSQLLQPSAPSPLPPPPPPPLPHGGGGAGSIRPGSMADRARMANIPMPETALKCPRCESANTKFCYFNNYSLTQPRHFCKTCRRYWTRGGALRNVPVGGGCRRNKRTKGSGGSSKSPVSSSDRQTGSMTTSGSSGAVPSGNNNMNSDILGLAHQVPPGLRFMTPLHHQLTHHHHDFAAATSDNLGFSYGGLNYGSMSAPMVGGADLSFHIGSSALSGGGGGTGPSSLLTGFEQWRMQQPPQFPFMASGLDPASAGLFESQGGDGPGYQPRPKLSSSAITHQMASVKMEDNNHHHHHHHHHQQQQQQHELNLSRQLMGNDQYWNGGGGGGGGGGGNSGNNAWTTDPSGFSSSSTTSNQL